MGVKLTPSGEGVCKVFAEPGDPYGDVLSLLRHGEVVVMTDFRDFAGQTWAEHEVDEAARGLRREVEPRAPYIGWSPIDLTGHRWLEVVVTNAQDDTPTDHSEGGGDGNCGPGGGAQAPMSLQSLLAEPTAMKRCYTCG